MREGGREDPGIGGDAGGSGQSGRGSTGERHEVADRVLVSPRHVRDVAELSRLGRLSGGPVEFGGGERSGNLGTRGQRTLCLEHHSEYDSTTRQHKNYTMPEVKKARDDLHAAIQALRHLAVPAVRTEG